MTHSVLPAPTEKAAYVESMFDRIAVGYDRANDLMTGGMHRLWKARTLKWVSPKPGEAALDLATGTGDIAVLLAKAVGLNAPPAEPGEPKPVGEPAAATSVTRKPRVIGLDFSTGMLEIAKARTDAPGVEWLQGDMLALPFPDASFDVITVGFGLRNVADLDQALREIARVLRPGGRFASLETARPYWRLMRAAMAVHARIVPAIGRLAAGESDPYRYLHQSTTAFVDQDTLAERCRMAGLAEVHVDNLAGGSVAIVSGTKPKEGTVL